MKNKKSWIYIGIIILLIGILIYSYFISRSQYKFREDRSVKIFILNSYHEDFPIELVTGYIKGFKEIFEREDVEIGIKQFDMDVLRHNSEELKQEAAVKAKNLIDEWQPDLIFATDDPAQKYVIAPYYLNTNVPVVFASLSNEPSDYNYAGSKNVAGVLEREHLVDAIEFLRELFPYVKKIAVISESHPRWTNAIKHMKEQQKEIPEIDFIGWHRVSGFKEFQEKVLDYQNKTDAFLFTPLDNLDDDEGNKVLLLDVIKWLAENSKIPEVSLWPIPHEGMLAAVSFSPYEQGKVAGKIAYGILINGKKPSSFEFKPTEIGDQHINLARAKTLGLEKNDIPSSILINSNVIKEFPWEKSLDVFPTAKSEDEE